MDLTMTELLNADNNSKTNLLASFGGFIKDHGIAIFLVVFFVIYIYPEQADERKEWITQITKLQDSLDPAKRNITSDQSKIILELALDNFIQSLQSTMSQYGYDSNFVNRSYNRNDFYERNGKKVIRLYDQEFEVDMSKADEIKNQIEQIYKKYKRLTKIEELYVIQESKIALDKAVKSGRYVTAGLRSFKYADNTLADLGSTSFNVHYSSFSKELINSFTTQRNLSFEKNKLLNLYEMLELEAPDELSKVNDSKIPPQIIYEFRENLIKSWSLKLKPEVFQSRINSSLLDRVTNKL
tara:strand:- start:3606 stop:4496 length:891 start_codon:yes stop_codon:yes gene_type:complete